MENKKSVTICLILMVVFIFLYNGIRRVEERQIAQATNLSVEDLATLEDVEIDELIDYIVENNINVD